MAGWEVLRGPAFHANVGALVVLLQTAWAAGPQPAAGRTALSSATPAHTEEGERRPCNVQQLRGAAGSPLAALLHATPGPSVHASAAFDAVLTIQLLVLLRASSPAAHLPRPRPPAAQGQLPGRPRGPACAEGWPEARAPQAGHRQRQKAQGARGLCAGGGAAGCLGACAGVERGEGGMRACVLGLGAHAGVLPSLPLSNPALPCAEARLPACGPPFPLRPEPAGGAAGRGPRPGGSRCGGC